MWVRLTNFFIRNRFVALLSILAITIFFGYKAKDVKMSYDFPQVIPITDVDFIYYEKFKKVFGEDGDLLILGFKSKEVFNKDLYNDWYLLGKDLKKLPGVTGVAGVYNLLVIDKDTATKRFRITPIHDRLCRDQKEADSVKQVILDLQFYRNLFYNDSTHATLMAIKLDGRVLRSKDRIELIHQAEEVSKGFSKKHNIDLAYTGLPYIRTIFAGKIQQELNLFLALSVLITSLILYLFFRSIYSVLLPLIIITIIIILSLGFVSMLGYKLTLLTGLIPPLIVIIAVPNFIYFQNRYHMEYRKYNNKLRAIMMMVNGIARVVFLNNLTTAIGFGVLYFINSPILKEFGLVAFFMITATFFATLVVMPVVLSYMPAPNAKHINYMQNRSMTSFIGWVLKLVLHKRKLIYGFSILLFIGGVYGITKLNAVGYIMDDIPKRDKLYSDLMFFEENFRGVMPFEIIIDTKEDKGVINPDFVNKLDQLQDSIATMKEFSTTISIANLAKFATQAYYDGDPEMYRLPGISEYRKISRYTKSFNLNTAAGNGVGFKLMDSNQRVARVTTKMADVGSERLKQIISRLDKIIPSIFGKDVVSYQFSGFSRIFLKGNSYLIENLATSLVFAVLAVMIVIVIMFPSLRLLWIILLPNFLALTITGGIMGYLNIPLKPSSVLVFSIAFSIAVDTSFHFVAVYRNDMRMHNWTIAKTVSNSLKETGTSIIYTSILLLFGFGIFCFSTFGSTVALGALMAITIISATFTNIFIIPALLVSFDRKNSSFLKKKMKPAASIESEEA
ncbi:MAG: MMPL family transporter [Bacteroidota bacterium]|nr:MMPL family transporter [Bacteroidota bacterium]